MQGIYRRGLWVLLVVLVVSAAAAFGQTETKPDGPDAATQVKTGEKEQAAEVSVIRSLRDIGIGMSAEAVRDALGKPDVEDASGVLYTLDGGDMIQIGFDDKKNVTIIAATYTGNGDPAPTFTEVFGAKAAGDAEGDVYKVVSNEKDGIWLSYSRTNSADKPLVIVTIRKL